MTETIRICDFQAGKQPHSSAAPRAESAGEVLFADSDSVDPLNAIKKSNVAAPAINDPMLVATSQKMQDIALMACRIAPSTASVLVTGESGTGKEVLCHWIHRYSGRRLDRFVRVNCAAMSESLIESELFGHVRGAFTGASDPHTGKFECAHEGTILLDEISEIPVRVQAKLLRVIEEQELQRVGSNETTRLDVRVIATSNRNLKSEVAAGRFRLDLFHRLNVLHFELPALRERPDDLPWLVERFSKLFQKEGSVRLEGISQRALDRLLVFHWPGNIRQLRNVVHRACILATKPIMDEDSLGTFDTIDETNVPAEFTGLKLEEIERQVILAALTRFQGNKRLAAEHLGITARTINNKLQSYRMDHERAA